MFVVIRQFADKTDNRHVYNVGDTFPREGVSVSDRRVAELMSNGAGVSFIEMAPEDTEKATETSEDLAPAETPVTRSKAKKRPQKG